jgi:PGAP1-like protein
MRAVEVRDVSRLVGLALSGATSRVEEMHDGIAGRAFGSAGPPAAAGHRVHDVIAGSVYASVRGVLGGAAVVAGAVAAGTASGRRLDESAPARTALAILNGAYGDLLDRAAPALALPMTVRQDGHDVPLRPDALATAFPDATGSLVVFAHGLTESEGAWRYRAARHDGAPDATYGALLRQDLGMTPVYLRYNTGLHISDNGARLDALLAGLVGNWPVPVRDVVLIGHSMGGLIARSALHHAGAGTAAARDWTRLVRDTVTLGTPHLGAPLERGVHGLAHLLARLPETRAIASVLAARSVGIKDLRHGTLVEHDWRDRDLDAPGRHPHTHVPLHDGARHFVVLGTLSRDPAARTGAVVGDLLVTPRSASGDSGDEQRLAFPADRVLRLGGLHHFDLLNHPAVYRQLHRWLADRPPAGSDHR